MYYKSFLLKFIPVFLMLFAFPLYGKKVFRAPYVSFDIKENWICRSFGVDWVCHHYLYKGAKPSLMLVTAKEGNSADNLDFYNRAFNRNPTAFSEKIRSNKISVNSQDWMEGFYKNDLSHGMFNRYAATVCCDRINAKFHIFIGFHAPQENYSHYSAGFLQSIRTLRIDSKLSKILKQIKGQTEQQRKEMASYIDQIMLGEDIEKNIGGQGNQNRLNLLILGLILFFTGFLFYFLYYKKRKKRRRSGHKKRRPRKRRRHK